MGATEHILQTQYANRALLILGETPILETDPAFGTADPVSLILKTMYPAVAEAALLIHRWRFTIKQMALTEETILEPLNNWTKVFKLPADLDVAVRLLSMSSNTKSWPAYEMAGNFLYTNLSDPVLEYQYRPAEDFGFDEAQTPNGWPLHFVRFFTYWLAAELAYPVTEQQTKAEYLIQRADEERARAQHIDATIQPNIPIVDDAGIISGRFGGVGTITTGV